MADRKWSCPARTKLTATIAILLAASVSTVDAQSPVDAYLRELHKTPNWRVFTPDFLETIASRRDKLQGTPMTILGTVGDENEIPIEGALVVLRLNSAQSNLNRVWGVTEDVFATTWTDSNGVFKFRNQPTPWQEPLSSIDWEICVYAPEFALAVRRYQRLDGRVRMERFKLSPGHTIRGSIVDRNGEPILGAHIALADMTYCWRDKRGNRKFETEHSLIFSELEHDVEIRPDGSFEIGGLPARRVVSVRAAVPGFSNTGVKPYYRVATSDDLNRDDLLRKEHPRAGVLYPLQDPEFKIQGANAIAEYEPDNSWTPPPKQPTRQATVRVVDGTTGKGVAAVGVSVITRRMKDPPTMYKVPQAATDQDGVATLDLPVRDCHVVAFGRKWGYITQFERLTTSTQEFTPRIKTDQWVTKVPSGTDPVSLMFRVQPVPPLQVRVVDADGLGVHANVVVQPSGWTFQLLPKETNENGEVELPIRPVLFDVDLIATTKNGMKGEVSTTLSNDFDKEEEVTVIVKPDPDQ